jgi:hypothetical protein
MLWQKAKSAVTRTNFQNPLVPANITGCNSMPPLAVAKDSIDPKQVPSASSRLGIMGGKEIQIFGGEGSRHARGILNRHAPVPSGRKPNVASRLTFPLIA